LGSANHRLEVAHKCVGFFFTVFACSSSSSLPSSLHLLLLPPLLLHHHHLLLLLARANGRRVSSLCSGQAQAPPRATLVIRYMCTVCVCVSLWSSVVFARCCMFPFLYSAELRSSQRRRGVAARCVMRRYMCSSLCLVVSYGLVLVHVVLFYFSVLV
jgi:hypothetical protein